MTANEHITVGSNYYEKVKTFKYLGSLLINQNYVHEKIKCRPTAEKFMPLFSPNPFVFSTSL